MDGSRFDQLTRGLASGSSRRTMLKGLLGLGGTAAVSAVLTSETDPRRSSSSSTPTTAPPPTTTTPSPCQGFPCGFDCCDAELQCCDGECCVDGSVCIGEERCCPLDQMCGDVCCNGDGQRCCGGVCIDAGQCCADEECLNNPGTCQSGFCDLTTNTCGFGLPCADSEAGTTCCEGQCLFLGTTTNCLACGDTCTTGEACCTGGCTPLGTVTDCSSCGDICSDGLPCVDGACGCDTSFECGNACPSCACPDGPTQVTLADGTTRYSNGGGFCKSPCSGNADCPCGELCVATFQLCLDGLPTSNCTAIANRPPGAYCAAFSQCTPTG